MPGSPSALFWPQEWIIIGWSLLGALLFLVTRKKLPARKRSMELRFFCGVKVFFSGR